MTLDRVQLCLSSRLREKGNAHTFDVLHDKQPLHAFALRFDGQVVAYLNRCVHVAAEMEWQPDEFLDSRKQWILCSLHGAAYEPLTGKCGAGPCGRGSLTRVQVQEEDGQVYWLPSAEIQPLASPAPSA
ncbi:MAG: 2Fe-2S ferredoxin [Rhizobacter sp.]|nr:2Fe-2S ferredoxin [Rhizobacter sp.]